MKKRLLTGLQTLLILSLVITSIATPMRVNAANAIKEGDYIKFGKYNNQSILWRVIDFDDDGDPLLFSDKILCTKAYDAMGNHKIANKVVSDIGYSNWEMSNIRAWLNSTATAGNVVYPCGVPPISENLRAPMPYDQEKGFLADGNFTEKERAVIKTVSQKMLLTEADKKEADGGSILYSTDFGGSFDQYGNEYFDIKDAMKNYDKAYYKLVEDQMFYLDEKQAYDVYAKFGDLIGGKLTKEAAADANRFEELRGGYSNYKENDIYWTVLRSPRAFEDQLTEIDSEGRMIGYFTYSNGESVRPAFFLDMTKASLQSGTGSEKDPYLLSTGVEAPKSSISVDIDGTIVTFNNNYGYPFVDGANRTQVPLRITMESYGATVDYDTKTSTAIVAKDGVEVRVPVGQKYILKNGERIIIDTAAIVKNNRTYLPIRPVVEALAGQVTWDNTNKIVGIKDLFKMISTTASQVDAKPMDEVIEPGKIIRVSADPRKGFNYDYLLYMPSTVTKEKESTVMVETLNLPGQTKDAQDAVNQSYNVFKRGEQKVAESLGSPFIIPCIERPADLNGLIYTHGFDRDTLLQKTGRYARLDLQVANMILDSQKVLKNAGYTVDGKVFMWGFSGSGQFAHRFTALYPNLVKACASGGNSKVILPITELNGTKLIFPIGVADLKKDANIDFNQKAYLDVPQFMFMGGQDKGDDDVYYLDSYSKAEQGIIFKVYGEGDSQFYWSKSQELNKPYSSNIEYKLYPNLAHTYDDVVLEDVTSFFKKNQ